MGTWSPGANRPPGIHSRTGRTKVTAGGVGRVAASGEVELEASAAHLVLARDAAELEQSAAGVLAARSVEISDSAVGVMLARNVTARNAQALFGGRAAIAFGATAGAVLWLLGRWRPR